MKEPSLRSDTLGSVDDLMVSSPCSDPQAKITHLLEMVTLRTRLRA